MHWACCFSEGIPVVRAMRYGELVASHFSASASPLSVLVMPWNSPSRLSLSLFLPSFLIPAYERITCHHLCWAFFFFVTFLFCFLVQAILDEGDPIS